MYVAFGDESLKCGYDHVLHAVVYKLLYTFVCVHTLLCVCIMIIFLATLLVLMWFSYLLTLTELLCHTPLCMPGLYMIAFSIEFPKDSMRELFGRS
jgi:hypothetical protein